jgi:glycosyltransferase involved in cell wall biosynthesis
MPKYITEQLLKVKHTNADIVEYKNDVTDSVQKPLISVILITYQHLEFIEKSVSGILNQNIDCEWEFIIGDDESKDGTREICIRLAEEYPDRIRLFLHSQKNSRKILEKPCGIFQITCNLLKARGRYIAICSGDDVWTDPLKLQKQLGLMTSDQEISLCYQSWRKV